MVLDTALSVSLTDGADGTTAVRETNLYLEYVSVLLGAQPRLCRVERSLM